MNKHWIHIRNFKDGNIHPALNDYEYDQNGNMVKDRNKGITSITYNHLNLPVRVEWSANEFILYQYNAAGQKLTKTVRDNDSIKIVRYLDGFQYAGDILQFFPTAEGYVKATPIGNANPDLPPTGYAYNYTFNYTDHLGNIRLSYTKDPQSGTLQILEENHYYPFGLRHEVYVTGSKRQHGFGNDGGGDIDDVELINVLRTDYQYKYNGKEFQDELGLNWTSMDFRNYDPTLGRFHVIDPLAAFAPSSTPFRFGFNNPVYWSDPTGLFEEGFMIPERRGKKEGEVWEDDDGKWVWDGSIWIDQSGEEDFVILEDGAVINGKAEETYAFSNLCIVGCHNNGGQFDQNGFSIFKTTKETFPSISNGLINDTDGFGSDFYRPGDEVKRVEMIPLREDSWGLVLFEFLKYLDLLKKTEKNTPKIKGSEIIIQIVDTVIIDKSKAPGNMYIDRIMKDTVIKMPADTFMIKFESWNKAAKQNKVKLK